MATDPVPSQDYLEPLDFWEIHKGKIIVYGSLLLLGAIAFGAYSFQQEAKRTAAGAAYSAAHTPGELEEVIRSYMGTVVAGDAALQLADQQRQEKKYDEAVATLRAFIAKNPEHPLIAGAWLSLANTLEVQGKTEEALDVYQQTGSKYPKSYAAPIALISEARLRVQAGHPEAAKPLYEGLIARFPKSLYAREAMRELRFLNQ